MISGLVPLWQEDMAEQCSSLFMARKQSWLKTENRNLG
jgi:hypothetical protein